MGEKLTDFGEEMKALLTGFGEEMKELIKKGVEEAFEKAMEAVCKSLAEWEMESRSTSHLPNEDKGEESDKVEESTQSKETYSDVTKLLPEIRALQVFDENTERRFVQKAPSSISQGTNPIICPPNPYCDALKTHCKMVMVYKLHENEYGKFSRMSDVGGGYDDLGNGIGLGGSCQIGMGFGVGYRASGSGGGPGGSYGSHGGIDDDEGVGANENFVEEEFGECTSGSGCLASVNEEPSSFERLLEMAKLSAASISCFLLNCESTTKIMEENGLTNVPDHNYVSVGNITTIKKPGLTPRLTSLRYFNDTVARKFCYNLPVKKGDKFLVRATYYYGGFDAGKEPPNFDQIIDGTLWGIVNTTEDYADDLSSYYEIDFSRPDLEARIQNTMLGVKQNEETEVPQITAQVEALKRNTDCVYFLATPLTCKKGIECEYHHSDIARLNSRDCWFWLNGNCLNPKCAFQHPPLDGLLGTPVTNAVNSLPPSQTMVPVASQGLNVPGKQAVPCIFFQKGYCLKGDMCSFMHAPYSLNSKSVQSAGATPVSESQPNKKIFGGLGKHTQVQKFSQGTAPKSAILPQQGKIGESVKKAPLRNEILISRNAAIAAWLDKELPQYRPGNVHSFSNGNSNSRSNRNPQVHIVEDQVHIVEDQSVSNVKDTDEVSRELSPGFDVLVDDELMDSEYYPDEDGIYTGHDGMNLGTTNEYGIRPSSDYGPVAEVDQDMYPDKCNYDSFERLQGHYRREVQRSPSERVLGGSAYSERRRYPRADSPGQINGSNLRHHLSKQKTSAYISQNDVHVGEMTVKETLDFSSRCQGVGSRYELLNELARREKEAGILPDAEIDLFMKATSIDGIKSSLFSDYTIRILGLNVCRDTLVGDDMIQGISGGQKKRVTTGELIVGPTKTLFMDEISTGLDSSTTFQIVKCWQQIVHLTEGWWGITFDLEDKVVLWERGIAMDWPKSEAGPRRGPIGIRMTDIKRGKGAN